MSDSSLIIRIGEALWGERWQAPMAAALGVHRDTVQDWRQGRFQPRPGVYAQLRMVAAERYVSLGDLLAELEALSLYRGVPLAAVLARSLGGKLETPRAQSVHKAVETGRDDF